MPFVGILGDLAVRADEIAGRFDRVQRQDLRALAVNGFQLARQAAKEARAEANKGADLADPDYWDVNVATLQRISRGVALLEYFPLAACERYSVRDAKLTALLARLLAESNWKVPVQPVVVGYSSDHYSNRGEYGVIFVPAAESFGLLGLPDLAHEAAHILIATGPVDLLNPVQTLVEAYLATLTPQDRRAMLDSPWLTAWAAEFVADVIALYVVGEAYLWQHLALTLRRKGNVCVPGYNQPGSHPAPKARFDLLVSAVGAVSVDVQVAWDQVAKNGRPTNGYNIVYPPQLLADVAQQTIGAIAALGMVGAAAAPPNGVVKELNDAWTQVRSNPGGYRTWENQARKRLGL